MTDTCKNNLEEDIIAAQREALEKGEAYGSTII